VHQHRAHPADLDLTGLLRAGQAEPVAQEVEQELLGGYLPLEWGAVDGGGDLFHHRGSARLRHQSCQYSSANSYWSLGPERSPAVPSKTGTPSGNSRPSWESSSRPPAVAPSAIEYIGWVWITAPTSGRAR